MATWLAFTLLCVITLLPAPSLAAPAPAYHLVRTTSLGGDSGWDLLTVDSVAKRLYVTRDTHIAVLDLATGKPVGDLPAQGAHGVALAPELGRGFATNGRNDTVTMFDLKTLRVLARIHVGKKPDVILYEPRAKRVLAFNGGSDNATVLDAATGKVAGTVALGGGPEFAVADADGTVYVNLEDKNALVAVDPVALKLLKEWPLAPCAAPAGLALDPVHHRLFAGCANERLVAVDTASGRVVAAVPIGKGSDAVAFDADAQLVFSTNGDGTLTVIHEDSPDAYTVVGNVPTQPGARTMALDTASHRIYTVAAKYGALPAAGIARKRRPPLVPGSVALLEFGP